MGDLWVQPLVLLPGVALLVMSTSARVGQLHEEIHRHLDGDEHHHEGEELIASLFVRARYFTRALVGLYLASALFVCSALIDWFVETVRPGEVSWVAHGVLLCGVLAMLYALVLLVKEAHLFLEVFKAHEREHEQQRHAELEHMQHVKKP